jgi:hypothetical protein
MATVFLNTLYELAEKGSFFKKSVILSLSKDQFCLGKNKRQPN